MRLENYILNEGIKVVKDLKSDEVYPFLQQKCKKALSDFEKTKESLWRGFKRYKGEYVIMDSSRGRPVDPKPYYYVIDQWKGFPKRSQSILCSIMYGSANFYANPGRLYMLFPFDGVKIAVAPEEDVWDSFDWIKPNYFMKKYGSFSSWKELKREIEGLDRMRREGELNHEEVIYRVFDERDTKLTEIYYDSDSLIETVKWAFDPKRNDFKVVNDVSKVIGGECWFEGKCVAIRNTRDNLEDVGLKPKYY